MNKWFLEMLEIIRQIRSKALDVQDMLRKEDPSADVVKGYLKTDFAKLQPLWNQRYEGYVPSYLARHLSFGMANDFEDIVRRDLPELEDRLLKLISEETEHVGEEGFLHLLHPAIVQSSYKQFKDGHLRDSVLNSVVAVFDLIRARTRIDLDGPNLVNKAFSLTDPYLVLSELETESGQNDQKGFIQLFSGSYQGIRNPKAHSLTHDLTETKAAQYLIHASLLARRTSEAQQIKMDPAKSQVSSAAKPIRAVHSRS